MDEWRKALVDLIVNPERPLFVPDYRDLISSLISSVIQGVREGSGQTQSERGQDPDWEKLRDIIAQKKDLFFNPYQGELRFGIDIWLRVWLLFYYDLDLSPERANAPERIKELFRESKGFLLTKGQHPKSVPYLGVLDTLENWDSLWQGLALYLRSSHPKTLRELTVGFPTVKEGKPLLGSVGLVEEGEPGHPGAKLLPDPLALAFLPMAQDSLDSFRQLLEYHEGRYEGHGVVWVSLKVEHVEPSEWLRLEGNSFSLALHMGLDVFPEVGRYPLPQKLRKNGRIIMSGGVSVEGEGVNLSPVGHVGEKLGLAEGQGAVTFFILAHEEDKGSIEEAERKKGPQSKIFAWYPQQERDGAKVTGEIREKLLREIRYPLEELLEVQAKRLDKYYLISLFENREAKLTTIFEDPEVWVGQEAGEGSEKASEVLLKPRDQAGSGEPRRILLLGEAGSGKSTLAKWLALKQGEKKTLALYVPLPLLSETVRPENWRDFEPERLLEAFVKKTLMKDTDISQEDLAELIQDHFVRGHWGENRAWLLLDALEQVEDDEDAREFFEAIYQAVKGWACHTLFCAQERFRWRERLEELESAGRLEKLWLSPLKKEKVRSLLEKLLGKEEGRRLYGLIQRELELLEQLKWPIDVVLFALGFEGEKHPSNHNQPSFKRTLERLIREVLKRIRHDIPPSPAEGPTSAQEEEVVSGVIRGLARAAWESVRKGSSFTGSIERRSAKGEIEKELRKSRTALREFTNLEPDQAAEEILKRLEREETGPFLVAIRGKNKPLLEFHSRQFFSYLLGFQLAEELKEKGPLWNNWKELLAYPEIGEIVRFCTSEPDLEASHISNLLRTLGEGDDLFRHKLFLACQVVAANPDILKDHRNRKLLEEAAGLLLKEKPELLEYLCPWSRFPFLGATLLREGSRLRGMLEDEVRKAEEDSELSEEHLPALSAARLIFLAETKEQERREILQVLEKGIQSGSARVREVSARIVGDAATQFKGSTDEEVNLIKGLRSLMENEAEEWWVRTAAVWALGRLGERTDLAREHIRNELREANRLMENIAKKGNPNGLLQTAALLALLRSRLYLEDSGVRSSPQSRGRSLKGRLSEIFDSVLKMWNDKGEEAWPGQALFMLTVRPGWTPSWIDGRLYARALLANENYVSLLRKAIQEKKPLLFEAAVHACKELEDYLGSAFLEGLNPPLPYGYHLQDLLDVVKAKERISQTINYLKKGEDVRARWVAAELLGRPLVVSAGLGEELRKKYAELDLRGPIEIGELGEVGEIAREVLLAMLERSRVEEQNGVLRILGRSLCTWHRVGVRIYERAGNEVVCLGSPPLEKLFAKHAP